MHTPSGLNIFNDAAGIPDYTKEIIGGCDCSVKVC
jgi:hypothetical protein